MNSGRLLRAVRPRSDHAEADYHHGADRRGKEHRGSTPRRALHQLGQTAVIVDVDDVADMVVAPGAGAAGLWFAAHEAHGALVAQWMRSDVNVVITVGPVYTRAEQAALYDRLPPDVRACRVLIDAPMSVTWKRVNDDGRRGASGQRDFHTRAHERFRSLVDDIPRDLTFNSDGTSAAAIATSIVAAVDEITG